MRRLGITLIVGLVGACAADAAPGHDRATITNGIDDDGDPAVVALLEAGQLLCTGTLIAPRVVLTAGHCIGGVDEVLFGATVAAPDDRRGVLLARAHPAFDLAALDNDVGVVLLDAPAPGGVDPHPFGAADLDGGQLRLVGFGRTGPVDESAPRKREGTAAVDLVEATTVRITPDPAQACDGDSGGPALFDTGAGELVIGVASSGDLGCAEYAVYALAAAYADDFIAPFVAATADGSAAVGARCYDDATCAAGTCRFPDDAPSIGYCTAPCGECPGAMQCEAGACAYPLPSPGAPGAPCLAPTECDSAVCARPASGDAVCAVRCVPDIFGCDDGFDCALDVDSSSGSSACFPAEAGGCCSASGAPSPGLWLLVMLALRRRRNARTPRARHPSRGVGEYHAG